jgi:chromatin assembly factor 1 subunit A
LFTWYRPVLTGPSDNPGTWTKLSKVIGPRTPFGRDASLIQYDYDSEYEWEEEDPTNTAEDVNSGGERSEEEDGDGELSDGWLCEDDEVTFVEGYKEDDGGSGSMDIDEDDSEMTLARRKINEREKKSKSGREAQKKKRTVGALLPIIKGPVWEEKLGSINYGPFESMRIQFLNGSFLSSLRALSRITNYLPSIDAYVGLNPLAFISASVDRFAIVTAGAKRKDESTTKAKTKSTKKSFKGIPPSASSGPPSLLPAVKPPAPKVTQKPLPEQHNVQLVRLCLENSDMKKQDLVALVFTVMTADKHKLITKVAITQSMKELGLTKDKTPGSKWYFGDEILVGTPYLSR